MTQMHFWQLFYNSMKWVRLGLDKSFYISKQNPALVCSPSFTLTINCISLSKLNLNKPEWLILSVTLKSTFYVIRLKNANSNFGGVHCHRSMVLLDTVASFQSLRTENLHFNFQIHLAVLVIIGELSQNSYSFNLHVQKSISKSNLHKI